MASDDETIVDDIIIPGIDRSALPKHVALRTVTGGVVLIIGTAHISEESAEDVSRLIRTVKPNQVLVELCPSRLPIIDVENINKLYLEHRRRQEAAAAEPTAETTENEAGTVESAEEAPQGATQRRVARDEDPQNDGATEPTPSAAEGAAATTNDTHQDTRERKTGAEQGEGRFKAIGSTLNKPGGILAVAISYMYESISSQVKLHVGEDMRTAAEEAAKLGAPIVLGDRPIGITLARAWAGLSSWQKVKLGYELLKVSFSSIKAEDIESLKNQDILTEMIKELSKQYPTLYTHLLAERDLYLASRLRTMQGPLSVGVVGLGHVEGIRKHWNAEIDVAAICVQPPSTSWKVFFLKLAVGMTAVCGSLAALLYVIFFRRS